MKTAIVILLLLSMGCTAKPKADADHRPLAAGVIAVHQNLPAK
jgi:hypothetical protein